MAEFQEVMMHARRMCNMIACEDCPLDNRHDGCRLTNTPVSKYNEPEMVEETERIIMAWAMKNPAPRYPTYREHVLEVFPSMNTIYVFGRCVCDLFGSNARPPRCDGAGHHDITCTACWEREIAAKIAKELGLSKEQHMEDK